jgi:hypothetical protein
LRKHRITAAQIKKWRYENESALRLNRKHRFELRSASLAQSCKLPDCIGDTFHTWRLEAPISAFRAPHGPLLILLCGEKQMYGHVTRSNDLEKKKKRDNASD